ncbi:MAG TPA: hypothetical protein VH879_05095 [Gemmatimonadales bacterium]
MRIVVLALGSAAMLCAAEPFHAQCSSAQHHQFDFVVGNWLVRNSSGHAIGTVTVSHEYGGCVLIERWRGVGNSGEGLGVIGYLPGSKTWHRDYIDHGGFVSAIDGHLDGATMVMTGTDYQSDVARMHRVTWTRKSDGSVEERWQTSTDAGRSWQVRFYGVLQRIAE